VASEQKRAAQLTRLELQIMQVLWESGASTVQTVQQKLPGEALAYTTVQTMLNILQKKGKVKRKLAGKA
jgi:BlaI family transcriptional regulator, penicillinase repressor